MINCFGGKKVLEDFWIAEPTPYEVTGKKTDVGIYRDIYGNQIIGNMKNLHITFSGQGNRVYICGEIVTDENVYFELNNNNLVVIDKNVIIKNLHVCMENYCECKIRSNSKLINSKLKMESKQHMELVGVNIAGCEYIMKGCNSSMYIGEQTQMGKFKISCSGSSSVKILSRNIFKSGAIEMRNNCNFYSGNNNVFNSDFSAAMQNNAEIIIGSDCTISTHCRLQTNDGHSIFNLVEKRKTNGFDIRKQIVVGDHVWIGYRCMILGNSLLEGDCIVGAQSLVKTTVPRNTIFGGVPAKLIKSNIDWNYKDSMTWDDYRMEKEQY